MTDKAERRKFLKVALAALATTAGVSGCRRETMAMCYSSAAPSRPEPLPDPESSESADEQPDKRAELTEQLKKLGEEEPPKSVKDIGAMCYVW